MSATGKSLAALLTAVVMFVFSLAQHGHPTAGQWVEVVIALAGAGLVWLAPRLDTYPWTKTGTAVVVLVANGVVTWIVGGNAHPTLAEWENLIIAAIGTVAVGFAPATVHTTGAAALPEAGP